MSLVLTYGNAVQVIGCYSNLKNQQLMNVSYEKMVPIWRNLRLLPQLSDIRFLLPGQ